MMLRMYINEVLIDEISILSTDGLAGKEDEMIKKNIELIDSCNIEPIFYIDRISSKMNL